MERRTIKRIAVIGPESTGKTEICQFLKKEFNIAVVEEYSRTYLEKISIKNVTYRDVLNIYNSQWQIEMDMLRIHEKIVVDTESIIAKYWLLKEFSMHDDLIESRIISFPYDFYLLTDTAIEWQPDPLRENKFSRELLFKDYLNELKINNLRYSIVSGTGEARIKNVINILQSINFI